MERLELGVKWIEKAQTKIGNGKADKREGKDIAHKKALSKGGKNTDGVKVQSRAKNRSFKRNSKSKNKYQKQVHAKEKRK